MTATDGDDVEYLHATRPIGPIMPAMERAARGETPPPLSRCGGPGPNALLRTDVTCPQCLALLAAERTGQ